MEEAQKYKAMGNSAFQEGNYYEAIEHFTKAIELNPNDHIFYSNRSGAYASLKQYGKALEDAEKCISVKPDWAKGYQRKGLAEFYLQKYDEAIASYEKGLSIDPSNQQLKEGLERAKGEKSHKGGMDEQTQQMLMKLMSNPKTREYMNDPEFVQKLQMMQSNPQMIGAFAKDPKIMTALQVMLGLPEGFNFDMAGGQQSQQPQQQAEQTEQAEQQAEEPKEQKKEFKAEKKESPKKEEKPVEPAEEAKIEGNNFYKKKEFDKAIEMYDKAISLKPTEVIYYSNKAAVYIEMKEYEKAHEVVDKAIEVMQETKLNDWAKRAKIFQRKASILANQKEFSKAIEYYEKALIEDNNSRIKEEMKAVQKQKQKFEEEMYVDPAKAEEHNDKGRDLFLSGKFPEALKEYEESIRRNPKEPKFYTNKASCLIKLMEFPTALVFFRVDGFNRLKLVEQALQLQPENPKAFAKKGQIHFGMKEYYKAQEAYEKGLKIDPENAECKDGLLKVRDKMYAQPETKEEAEERARHAMADPDIQNILRDPQIMILLQNMQENPHNPENMKAMRDPKVAEKLNKLIAAGIIKTH